MKEKKDGYPPPDKNLILKALNGDPDAIKSVFCHYESFGNYLIRANVLKFACVSGFSASRFQEEDIKQYLYLWIHKAIEGFM